MIIFIFKNCITIIGNIINNIFVIFVNFASNLLKPGGLLLHIKRHKGGNY